MPHQQFAAYLNSTASAAVDPWHFLQIIWAWLGSAAGSFVDTAEERLKIKTVALTFFDTVIVPKFPPAAMFRSLVSDGLDAMLLYFAPPPAPTPAPVVVPTPGSGAAP